MSLGDIVQVISTGGDIAVVAIAFAIWRLDRRVLVLEINARQRKEQHA